MFKMDKELNKISSLFQKPLKRVVKCMKLHPEFTHYSTEFEDLETGEKYSLLIKRVS